MAEPHPQGAEWISRLFPQKQTGTQAPKKQTKGGKSKRSSQRKSRGQRRQRGGEGRDVQTIQADIDTLKQQLTDLEEELQKAEENVGQVGLDDDEVGQAGQTGQAQEEELDGGARKSKRSTRKAAPKKGGAGSGAVRTSESIQHGGRDRVVYKGPRGGKYIKKGGEMVPISKL